MNSEIIQCIHHTICDNKEVVFNITDDESSEKINITN
jgi:hypothetical protein